MLTKILLTLAVIVFVWKLPSLVNSLKAFAAGDGDGDGTGKAQPPAPVEDTVKCPACGVYRAAAAPSCGQPDCPGRAG